MNRARIPATRLDPRPSSCFRQCRGIFFFLKLLRGINKTGSNIPRVVIDAILASIYVELVNRSLVRLEDSQEEKLFFLDF